MEHVEQAVSAVIAKVAAEKGLDLKTVQKHQKLVGDIGFKSIDLARIIAILEIKLNADPFAKLVPITSVQTVGDLCHAYRLCFEQIEKPILNTDFQESRSRAKDRVQLSRSMRGELRKKARTG
jgi:hypothetical protein